MVETVQERTCRICCKILNRKQDRVRHEKQMHKPSKQCSCGYHAKRCTAFKKHLRRVHKLSKTGADRVWEMKKAAIENDSMTQMAENSGSSQTMTQPVGQQHATTPHITKPKHKPTYLIPNTTPYSARNFQPSQVDTASMNTNEEPILTQRDHQQLPIVTLDHEMVFYHSSPSESSSYPSPITPTSPELTNMNKSAGSNKDNTKSAVIRSYNQYGDSSAAAPLVMDEECERYMLYLQQQTSRGIGNTAFVSNQVLYNASFQYIRNFPPGGASRF